MEYYQRLAEFDKRYYQLMREQYVLKKAGNLSLFEQLFMVAEDRAWWIKELEKDIEEQRKREGETMSSMPSIPGMPSIPSR